MLKYSIVICTYNRARFLKLNLEALRNIDFEPTFFEVLVIDNNSKDDTPKLVEEMQSEMPNLRYIKEVNQGLSYARNRGYQEAKGSFVVYLDDDAISGVDFLRRIEWVYQQNRYDAWGGIVNPWFPEGRPHWLKDRYVASRLSYKSLHKLVRPDDFFSGGAMIIRRTLLEQFNGFDPNLGMQGNTVAYGEETELQVRFKKAGIPLGYDPELQVLHAVLPHKLNIEWFFQYSFAAGRDMIRTFSLKTSFAALCGHFVIGLGVVLAQMVRCTPKLWFDKSYFIENWVIDVFRKFAKRLGVIYFGLLSKRSKGDWKPS